MSKILKCNCGEKKPYRRAHSCKACWTKTASHEKATLQAQRTSLRLPKAIRVARKETVAV